MGQHNAPTLSETYIIVDHSHLKKEPASGHAVYTESCANNERLGPASFPFGYDRLLLPPEALYWPMCLGGPVNMTRIVTRGSVDQHRFFYF